MLRRRSQSTLEYAMIIAVVVGGLLMMQHYVKRGLSGRLKSASDDLGEQYDPVKFTSAQTEETKSITRRILKAKESETEYLDLGGAEAGYGQTRKLTGGTEGIAAWAEDEDLFSK